MIKSFKYFVFIIILILSGCTGQTERAEEPEQEENQVIDLQPPVECEFQSGDVLSVEYDPEPPPEWMEAKPNYGTWNGQSVIFIYSEVSGNSREEVAANARIDSLSSIAQEVKYIIISQTSQVFSELEVQDSPEAGNIINKITESTEALNIHGTRMSGSVIATTTIAEEVDEINCTVLEEKKVIRSILRRALPVEIYVNIRTSFLQNIRNSLVARNEKELVDNALDQLIIKDEQGWQEAY